VSQRPRVRAVYETVVYAHDVAAVADFYESVLGMRRIKPPDDHSAAFRLEEGGVVLVFDPARSSAPGRFVPAHGTTGEGHVAFAVAAGELDAFKAQLAARGVDVEREITWPLGGRSLYFRDPAGNSLEVVEGEAWEP
jgi:catechol 2,3-dioxygenase-like lactoylglutathione lyase family enzyme